MESTIFIALGCALIVGVVVYFIMAHSSMLQREKLREENKAQIAELQLLQEKQLKALNDNMIVQTEKILREREAQLKQSNSENLEGILNPLKESISQMKTAMDSNAKSHIQTNTALSEQLREAVRQMQEKTADIGSKADSLSLALTGKPKVQGCFGETFLDDILSREGLEKGKHYDRELSNDDRSRPDFVFHFKEGSDEKDLIVDSKVSLTAYVSYMNAEDEAARKTALTEHLRSIKSHIDELASKGYAQKVAPERRFADYVLMFMPIDMAFRVALDADPMMWQYAYNKGILIATEQTIVPFIKIIQLTWNKYQHDSNMAEIVKAASLMVERVGLFYDSYIEMGKKLQGLAKNYNEGLIKLQDGGASITTAAKNVMKFGARRAKGRELEVPSTQVEI